MESVSNATLTDPLTKEQCFQLYIWASVALPIIFFGAIGNILTLIVIIRARWYATGIQVLILTLTICGTLTTSLVYPTAIIGAVVRNPAPWLVPGVCPATGYLFYSICCAIPSTCAMIAINRFCIIVFPSQTRCVTRKRGGIVMSVVACLISLLMFVEPLVEIDGRFGLIEPLDVCLWQQWTASEQFQGAFFLIIYVIPGIVIAVCYVGIFLYLRVTHCMYRTSTGTCGVGATNFEVGRKMTRLIQATKMMGVTFLVYVLCFLPLNIMAWVSVDLYEVSYSTVYAWLILLYCISDCLHPVIYAVMNRDFSNAYLDLFRHIPLLHRSSKLGLKEMMNGERTRYLSFQKQFPGMLHDRPECGKTQHLIPRDSIPRDSCIIFNQHFQHGGVYVGPQEA